jgi:hypothetical protein
MGWVKTVRLIIFVLPLTVGVLASSAGQSHPAPGHPSPPTAQNSKVHDRNWLKSQVKRRYGTSALPDKSASQTAEKKPATGDKPNQPSAKN